jgi:F-type H+-transporting ATPase subunit delta
VRQSIRGFTDAQIETTATDQLTETAAELAAVNRLLAGSQDLERALTDPGVPLPARRAVVTDLLESRVGDLTLRLLAFVLEADRATELPDNLTWLAGRIDAAGRGLHPVGEPVLGTKAAEERLDGYVTGVLHGTDGPASVDAIQNLEDEVFRFVQTVRGNAELHNALSSRDLPADHRKALVEDLLRPRASEETTRMAAYATQIGRPRDYEELLAHLVERLAAESNRRVADVRAAAELDDEQRRHLGDALSRVTGRPVEVRVSVDSVLLGGFVATIGDTVVDGSTRHRLELLKERFDMPDMTTAPTGDTGETR